MLSQTPQNLQKVQDGTERLQTALSMLSDDQLTQAISQGQEMAVLDALSMIKRKTLQHRINQSLIT